MPDDDLLDRAQAEARARYRVIPGALFGDSASVVVQRAAFIKGARWAMAQLPDREAVVEAMIASDALSEDVRAEARVQGSTQREPFLMFADAVLDLIRNGATK